MMHRHSANDADGTLSTGACEDVTQPATADAADPSQAASIEGHCRRERPACQLAQLRPQGGHDRDGEVRGADPRRADMHGREASTAAIAGAARGSPASIRLDVGVLDGESRAQSGLSVHSSAPSAFLAPMLSRSRSVVERSAPMPFSSCPVERNPRVERGSFNIVRNVLFWRHSRNTVSILILPGLTAKPYPRGCRLGGATTCPVRLIFSNESLAS